MNRTRISRWPWGGLLGLLAAGALWGQASAGDCATGNPCVTLSASSNSLTAGQTATLNALVVGTANSVTWSINSGAPGSLGAGNPPDTQGFSTNVYVAPSSIPARQTVTITATTVATPHESYSVTIQLTPPSITVSPATASPSAGGLVQFTQTGAASVTWSINPSVAALDGSIDPNSGWYTAPASITSSATVTVTAMSATDFSATGTARIILTAPLVVSVSISPAAATLTAGESQQFTATVTNTSNTAVTWSLNPTGVGTIDGSGLYTAPSVITSSQRVTVTATSAADITKTAMATVTLNVLTDVGTGAPNPTLQTQFIQAFYRNNFNNLVSVPPQGPVASLGGGVYAQKFSDAAKDAGVTYALVTASASVNPAPDGSSLPVAQIYPAMFAYYSSVGAATAGAPLSDTLNCPALASGVTCTYQAFDKNYVLFAFASPIANGVQDAEVTSAFYAAWSGLGGLGGPGIPTADSATVTASTGTTATAQTFTEGEIFSVTSGLNKGQTFGVVEPIFDVYVANGGAAGALGLPTGSAITFTSGTNAGVTQQTFEGGTLTNTPGGGSVQVPVGSVALGGLSQGGSFTLALGQTMTLSATVYDKSGNTLTNWNILWSSSSSQVVAVQAKGGTATLMAVGGGTATVLASAGGVTSARVTVVVTTPCCQVGDGAPLAVGNAFRAALGRDKIAAQVPVADAAARVGNGYVQMVQATGASGATVPYLLTEADQAARAYVVTGALLAAYAGMGGAGGTLGYPLGDASAGGTQLFAGGALSGSPVHLVTGLALSKWQALGYETGAAGAPVGDAAPFATIGADTGISQAFAQGTIFAATAGPRAGQAYFVPAGPILTAYTGAGGAAGSLGMPVTDATVSGPQYSQAFEGGAIAYAAGATVATVQAAPRIPAVLVAPATVTAGGHAVFAITGFPNGATVRVSVTGEPDFLVTTVNGAYSWDTYVPLASAGGLLTIHAADTHGPSAADGTLTVRSLAASRAGLAKMQGDNQTGLPGATLPLPLVVALADSSGSPVIGVTVTFQATLGAQLSAASAVTDSAGHAQTSVRLPASAGLALVTASAPVSGTALVTFGMVAAAANLPGFPALQQSGSAPLGHGTATIAQKGALLTAVASILEYHQNQGELPAPNGLAAPAALNAYLTSLCAADSHGQAVCDGFLSSGAAGEQIVNLWRAAQFTGGVDVTLVGPSLSGVADLVARGEPVLLSLELARNGVVTGGHFVTAIGVAADGSLQIQDPSPLLARTNLADYINGFASGGAAWQGTVLGAVRFAVSGPVATRFLAGVLSQPAGSQPAMVLNITSAAGACGAAWPIEDAVDASGNAPAEGALVSLLSVCDGAQAAYQLDLSAPRPYSAFATDLAVGGPTFDLSGGAAASYALTRPNAVLAAAPLSAAIAAKGILNGASFTGGLAPGGIMAIFGTGLSGAGTDTAVDVDGTPAPLLFASAFQVNAQIPVGTAPGTHTVRVKSAYGTAQQQAAVSAVAPAIFLLGGGPGGAVLNQDNSLNTPLTPLPRGQVLQVFATGLGATVKQGQYAVAAAAVTAVVNGTELPVAYAGLAPGFVGLNQVNIPIPAGTAPGSGISLTLKQGGQVSNTVEIALQ